MKITLTLSTVALSLSIPLGVAGCAASAGDAERTEETRAALRPCTPGLDLVCPPSPTAKVGGTTTPPPATSTAAPEKPKTKPPPPDALGETNDYASCITDCLSSLSDGPSGFGNTGEECAAQCAGLLGAGRGETGDQSGRTRPKY